MNRIAVGTYRVPLPVTEATVLEALQAGLRRVDTAALYKNEKEVGDAVRNSGISRNAIHVTTKIHPKFAGSEKATKSLENSLNNLGLGYIDTVLIHRPDVWGKPVAAHPQLIKESWFVLETYYKEGLVKNVGVSNFSVADLERLATYATIQPTVNQICCNSLKPPSQELIDYCKKHSIQLEGYSPFGGEGAPCLKGTTASAVLYNTLKTFDYVVYGGDLAYPCSTLLSDLRTFTD
jgi:diketogulonate reductase-like aldo/keto reductase